MKCKRCGTPINALDHLCLGCGKSIIALREDDEIIYNEEELSQVEIEKMNKKEESPNIQPVEENKESLDIFGDALFNNIENNNETLENKNLQLEEHNNDYQLNINSNLTEEINPFELDNNEEQLKPQFEENNNDYQLNINNNLTEEINPFELDNNKSASNEEQSEKQFEETINAEKLIDKVEQIEIIEESIDDTINAPKIPTVPVQEQIIEQFDPEKEIEISNNNDDPVVPTKIKKSKRKSKVLIILIIVAFILLGLASVMFYFYNKTSPSKIFSMIIDKASLNFVESENIKNEVSIMINMPDDENSIIELINNLQFNMTSHTDGNKAFMKVNPSYKNKTLFDIDLYRFDKEVDIYLNNIYDKYILINEENSGIEFNTISNDFENIKIVVKELKNEIKKSLNSKYLTRDIEKIEINGKNEYINKSTYTLDNSNYKELFDNLKNNKELIKSLSEIINLTEEEITINEEQYFGKMQINLYSKLLTNELVKIEINLEEEENYSLVININNDVYDITYKNESSGIEINGSVKKELINSKPSYTFKLDDTTLNISLKTTYDQELNLVDENNKISVDEIEEEEFNKIIDNLTNNEGIVEIINVFDQLFGSVEEDVYDPNEDIDTEEFYNPDEEYNYYDNQLNENEF